MLALLSESVSAACDYGAGFLKAAGRLDSAKVSPSAEAGGCLNRGIGQVSLKSGQIRSKLSDGGEGI